MSIADIKEVALIVGALYLVGVVFIIVNAKAIVLHELRGKS